MATFEDSLVTRLTKSNHDPAATDLEYYAKPENYEGSNLTTMQRLLHAQRTTPQPIVKEGDLHLQVPGGTDDNNRPTSARSRSSLQERPVSARSPSNRQTNSARLRWSDIARHHDLQQNSSRSTSPEQTRLGGIKLRTNSTFSGKSSIGQIILSNRPSTTAGRRKFSREFRAALAKSRFSHAIRIVLILLKWISSLSEKGEEDEEGEGGGGGGRTFTDIASEAFTSDAFLNSGLSFDVSYFKAKKEVNISNEVKQILSTPASLRTPDQLQTALFGLQHLKSFAEYPLHMQQKLCKVAWFQQIPPKRVIIRQGHFAENFYFILAGQAVVRILEKNPKTGDVQLRTATIMRKGTSFGELALLHHSRRTATVVSQDGVQLLAIGRDDFFDIFMSGQGAGEMPEHIKFVSTLEFMKGWPIEELMEHPEACLFHFFKRGVVIVKDSSQSDWLYIVKSGSCQVLKDLKGVLPQDTSRAVQIVKRDMKLPRLGTGDIESKVDMGKRPRNNFYQYDAPSELRQAMTSYKHLSQKSTRPKSKTENEEENTPKAPENDNAKGPGFSKSKFTITRNARKAHFKPQAQNVKTPPPPSTDVYFYTGSHKQRPITANGDCRSWRPKTASHKTSRPKSCVHIPNTPCGSAVSRPKSAHSSHSRVSRPSRAKSVGSMSVDSGKENKGEPVFVQVEVLKPKDVFGLTTLTFDHDIAVPKTTVSLVSNGAECVMLSKAFFVKHANEEVKKMIRYNIRPYPHEDKLQENLQIKVDWDVYKKKLIKDVVREKVLLKNNVWLEQSKC